MRAARNLTYAAAALLAAVTLLQGTAARAQPEAQTLRAELERAAASVAARLDCRVVIRGTPIYQQFSAGWVAFFMADGPDCDAAVAALNERAEALEVLLARRPTLEQAGAEVRSLLMLVRGGFDCRITPRGEPSFQDASGDWLVMYLASGSGCDAASAELNELGKERQLVFVRSLAPQDLLR